MGECLVVGGGLIGLLTARELVAAGRTVTLIERDEPGHESSWAGGGILSPLYPWRYAPAVTRLAHWSQTRYPSAMSEITDQSGIDPEWTRSGLLMLDVDDPEEARAWAADYSYQMESVDHAALHGHEPLLADSFTQGLWMPEIAQVRNPRLLKALKKVLETSGVRFVNRSPVRELVVESGRITAVKTDHATHSADVVVIASGAWSAQLLDGLVNKPDISPVMGQMILYKTEPGMIRHIVLHQGKYVIPRRDGRVLVGSTLEHTGFEKAVTDEARAHLSGEAARLIPALADCEIEHHWAGLRPASPQGIPYIGEHPAVSGLYVNAGHFRNGVVLGLASARLLSDLILHRAPIVDPRPYALDAERGSDESL